MVLEIDGLGVKCVSEGVDKAGLIKGHKDPASVDILTPLGSIGRHVELFFLTAESENLGAKNFDRHITSGT